MNRFLLALALALSAAALGFDTTHAQDYPNRPIRLMVPFAPGGGVDTTARVLAAKVSESIKQTVIVDHRPGAGGTIGADFVAKAPPDGYTIMLTVSGLAAAPALFKSLPFDPIADLAPVTQVAASTLLLVVTPTLPANSARELIALAKAKPGSLNYGSSGVGAPLHLTMEIFKHSTGIDIVHIPFKGDAPMNTALIAGDVQLAFLPASTGVPLIDAGRVRALGLIGSKRAAALPDVPTLTESGVNGLESSSWYGVFAPAKTPRAIIDTLQREFAKAVKSPDFAERMRTQGDEPIGSTPEVLGALVKADVARFARIVEIAGIPKQ
jgi:tripartite-type tricarboxylate transporter receptor subunit TctC